MDIRAKHRANLHKSRNTPPKKGNISMKPSEQARARELYALGISRGAIAKRLGASRSAVTKWTADMPVREKPCPVCNERFRPKRTNQRYCSKKCSRHQGYEGWKKRHISLPPSRRSCEVCGQRFQPRNDPRQVYCSPKCRDQVRNHQNYLKRKAAKRNAPPKE